MYTTNGELRELVQQWQSTGVLPDRMGEILYMISSGVWQRFRTTIEKEDLQQEFVAQMLRKYRKIKICDNIFGYLTTICRNAMRQLERSLRHHEEKIERYRERQSTG